MTNKFHILEWNLTAIEILWNCETCENRKKKKHKNTQKIAHNANHTHVDCSYMKFKSPLCHAKRSADGVGPRHICPSAFQNIIKNWLVETTNHHCLKSTDMKQVPSGYLT